MGGFAIFHSFWFLCLKFFILSFFQTFFLFLSFYLFFLLFSIRLLIICSMICYYIFCVLLLQLGKQEFLNYFNKNTFSKTSWSFQRGKFSYLVDFCTVASVCSQKKFSLVPKRSNLEPKKFNLVPEKSV